MIKARKGDFKSSNDENFCWHCTDEIVKSSAWS